MMSRSFPHPAGVRPGGGPAAQATKQCAGPVIHEIAGTATSLPGEERGAAFALSASLPCGAPLPRRVEHSAGSDSVNPPVLARDVRSGALLSNRCVMTEQSWRRGIVDMLHACEPHENAPSASDQKRQGPGVLGSFGSSAVGVDRQAGAASLLHEKGV